MRRWMRRWTCSKRRSLMSSKAVEQRVLSLAQAGRRLEGGVSAMRGLTTESQSHRESEEQREPRTSAIIGAAIEVHRYLGPGLLESAYEECLCYELSQIGLRFERQVHLLLSYKGIKLECGHKLDLVVEDSIVVELKSIEDLTPLHHAQLLTYLKSSNKRVGLLIN